MQVVVAQRGAEPERVDLAAGTFYAGGRAMVDGLIVRVVELRLTFAAVKWGDGTVGPVSYTSLRPVGA